MESSYARTDIPCAGLRSHCCDKNPAKKTGSRWEIIIYMYNLLSNGRKSDQSSADCYYKNEPHGSVSEHIDPDQKRLYFIWRDSHGKKLNIEILTKTQE